MHENGSFITAARDTEHAGDLDKSPEWDTMAHNGMEIENLCPTEAPKEPDNLMPPAILPEFDLDETGPGDSYSQLARDLLEILGPEHDESTGGESAESFPSERQRSVLPFMAAFPNTREAAQAAGVSRSTIYRWMQDEVFRKEVERLRKASAQIAQLEIQGLMLQAVQVLSEALNHEDASIRLRAARSVLQYGIQLKDIQRLQSQVKDLHDALSD